MTRADFPSALWTDTGRVLRLEVFRPDPGWPLRAARCYLSPSYWRNP